MISYQEMLDRATQLASGLASVPGGGVDREMTVEAILPHAVRSVYRDQARTGRHLENIANEYAIQLTSGEGSLSDEILREYLDRSFCPRNPYASFVPWVEYGGYRLSNQLSYYAERGGRIAYSGALPDVIGTMSVQATLGSNTLIGDATQFKVGDRVSAISGLTVYVDAFITAILGSNIFTVSAEALNSGTLTATVYNGQDDADDTLSAADAVTVSGSAMVTSATMNFDDSHIGRRLKIVKTGVTVLDSIVHTVTNSTTVVMRGKASLNETGATATFRYTPLLLRTPGIPSLTSCQCLHYVPEVAEDIIVKTAAVLRGEMPLPALIALGNG